VHLVSRWSGGVNARGWDAIVRCQNLRPDDPNDAEDLWDLISLGLKEFWADQRLDRRAVTEGLRELGEAKD
jgi:hypothetical protein